MSKKISELSPASQINDQDNFVLEQGIAAKKLSGLVLKGHIQTISEDSAKGAVTPYVQRAEAAAKKSEAAAARAEEVKDSIPEDYTGLSDGVNQLNDDFAHSTEIIGEAVGLILPRWTSGMIDASNGNVVTYGKNTAVSNFVKHDGLQKYIVDIPSNMRVRAFLFATESTAAPIGDTSWHDGVYTVNIGTKGYIRFCVRYSDSHVADYAEIVQQVSISAENPFGVMKSTEDNAKNISVIEEKLAVLADCHKIELPSVSFGVINANTGEFVPSNNRIVTDYVKYNQQYFTVTAQDNVKTRVFFYKNTEGDFFSATQWYQGNHQYRASSEDAQYYRMCVAYADDRVIGAPYEIYKLFVIQNDVQENDNTEDIATIGIFPTFGVIGDSYSRGRFKLSDADQGYSDFNAWGNIIARDVGNACLLLGLGGTNTRTWLTAPDDRDGGPIKLMASDPQPLYILCLGINDTSLGLAYIGSESDIKDDYTQNADTFWGNYGRIIGMCQEKSPNCRFVISKLAATNDPEMVEDYNAAISGIASHYGIPVIDPNDDKFFKSSFYLSNKSYGHPTGAIYGGMAKAYMRLISKCINDNAGYFKWYNVSAPNDGKYRYWQGY